MSKRFDFDTVTVHKFSLSTIMFDAMLVVSGGSDCLKQPVFMGYLRGTSAGTASTNFVLKNLAYVWLLVSLFLLRCL
jgi:hypothetical protein